MYKAFSPPLVLTINKKDRLAPVSLTFVSGIRLISVVVATAIAATASAVTATTTAAAKAATAAISAAAKGLVFLRLGFIHFDSTAFYRSAIQLGNCLAGCFIVGHFDKTESAGPA